MFCRHTKTMTYTLSEEDKRDFKRRVANCPASNEHKFGENFLTPNIRTARAKSVVNSTNTSDGRDTFSKIIDDVET